MKTAFAYWDKRIAPVFDTARQIHVVETESGRIVCEALETLESDVLVQKALRLSELGINALVCGAVSRYLNEMIDAYGIRVFPFVAGDLREVIQAWLKGTLKRESFSMPGCRGSRNFNGTGQCGGPGHRRGRQCRCNMAVHCESGAKALSNEGIRAQQNRTECHGSNVPSAPLAKKL